MARLELMTNLKLIEGTARTTIPTVDELPLGFMCFGIVNGKASIWGNYNNTVEDLGGSSSVEIVQVLGESTTAVISQAGVTTALEAKVNNSQLGTASGQIPTLDTTGKLPESVIPATAITDVFVVATEAEMLALTAQKGDVAIRTDINKSFILQATPATTLTNWKEILAPTGGVTSVNGFTGNVILTTASIDSSLSPHSAVEPLKTERLSTSMDKINAWYENFSKFVWADKIDGATDIVGLVSLSNLPVASYLERGTVKVLMPGGITVDGAGQISIDVGEGLSIRESGELDVDVVLTVATI